jgi:hypothetical protein
VLRKARGTVCRAGPDAEPPRVGFGCAARADAQAPAPLDAAAAIGDAAASFAEQSKVDLLLRIAGSQLAPL